METWTFFFQFNFSNSEKKLARNNWFNEMLEGICVSLFSWIVWFTLTKEQHFSNEACFSCVIIKSLLNLSVCLLSSYLIPFALILLAIFLTCRATCILLKFWFLILDMYFFKWSSYLFMPLGYYYFLLKESFHSMILSCLVIFFLFFSIILWWC